MKWLNHKIAISKIFSRLDRFCLPYRASDRAVSAEIMHLLKKILFWSEFWKSGVCHDPMQLCETFEHDLCEISAIMSGEVYKNFTTHCGRTYIHYRCPGSPTRTPHSTNAHTEGYTSTHTWPHHDKMDYHVDDCRRHLTITRAKKIWFYFNFIEMESLNRCNDIVWYFQFSFSR